MPWRLVLRAAGTLLLVAALVVLLLGVGVRAAGSGRASCGSPFDAVAGRTGWETWRSQDLRDPAIAGGDVLVRTTRCVDAVNRRIVLAGALVAAAAAAVATGELLGQRGTAQAPRPQARGADRLRALGVAVTAVGGALTVAGVIGVVLLVADPRSALFLYVDRAVVVLLGAVLMLPAVALVVAGRALVLVARAIDERQVRGEA